MYSMFSALIQVDPDYYTGKHRYDDSLLLIRQFRFSVFDRRFIHLFQQGRSSAVACENHGRGSPGR